MALISSGGPRLRAVGPTAVEIDLGLPLTPAQAEAAAQEAEASRNAVYTPVSWERKPTDAQVWAVWPELASQTGYGGTVRLRCHVLADGSVTGCVVDYENPIGLGFGAAALKLGPVFKMKPGAKDGVARDGTVTIPVIFGSQEGTDLKRGR